MLICMQQADSSAGQTDTKYYTTFMANVIVNFSPPTLSAKRRGLRAAYAHTGQTLARCPV